MGLPDHRAASAAAVLELMNRFPISDSSAPTSFPLIPTPFRIAVTSTRLPVPSGMIV
jgi:hypothetical protein